MTQGYIYPKAFIYSFKKGPGDLYKCNNEKCLQSNKQKANSGYSNLYAHLKNCVGADYEEKYQEIWVRSNPTLERFSFITGKEKDWFKWTEWVVMRDMSLSEVDNELTCEGIKYVNVLSKTLRKDIISLSNLVAKEIKKFLPSQFGLMFDGWTGSLMHKIGFFSCFVVHNGKYNEVLLAIQPMLDEQQLDTAEHVKLFKSTLPYMANPQTTLL